MSLALFDAMFGSKARARVIRFFLLNTEGEYAVLDVTAKILLPRADVAREVNKLLKLRMIIEKTRKGKKVYVTNTEFPFYTELKSLASKLNVHAQSQV
ncbi:MAG: hypothetical protein QG606_573, partial [Patescibacteria group bacterium]|nr:hypothetical protein [Patescibacteria group bacterium]